MSQLNGQMQVVLLAAGEGARLREGGHKIHKSMIEVLGKSLAERSITTFKKAGIENFVVVLGSEAEKVKEFFSGLALKLAVEIEFAHAEDWKKGNGVSAARAESKIKGDRFLLAMIDHLFSIDLIKKLLESPPADGEVNLAIDRNIDEVFDIDDLTKVVLDDHKIVEIGKQLSSFDAGDTGLFHCTKILFEALAKGREAGGFGLSDGVSRLIGASRFKAVDVTGCFWQDVDTNEMIAYAEKVLASSE